jgi:hypothetical protein
MLVGIVYPPKQSTESFVVGIDFTPELAAGETISARTVTSRRRNDDTDSSATFLSGSPGGNPGPTCTIRVQAGAHGETHRVQMQVTTSLNNTFENELDVPVEDQ